MSSGTESDDVWGGRSRAQAPSGRRVVAIVANRDGRDYLLRCLRQLEGLAHRCSEIVVADDASSDGSVEAVTSEFPEAHVVRTPMQLGAAGVRNLGIEFARQRFGFDYLLFLDNDAFLEPGALTELLETAEESAEIGIVTPKAYQSLAERRLHLAGELRVSLYTGTVRDVGAGEIDEGQYDGSRLIEVCSGFTMLVRKEVIDRIRGFDAAFGGAAWEDVDFCLRAGAAGFLVAYAPEAVVEHVGGMRGRGRLADRERAKARNWFRLMRRHATPLQWLCFLATLPLRTAQLALERLSGGEIWAISAQAGGVGDLLRDMMKRRRSD